MRHISEVADLACSDFNVIAVASRFCHHYLLGWMATSSLAGAFPEVLIDIMTSFPGKRREALQAQRKLTTLLPVGPSLGIFKLFESCRGKCILEYRGFCNRYTSSYYRDASDEECEMIIAKFKEYYPELT